MASFKVPCPSCENEVLITNPNVIGSKTECPKCKYRFKVEEPAGGMPKEEAKGEKTDKVGKGKGKEKDKKDKNKDKLPASTTPGGKKKSKKLVAFVVGGLAIVVLAVVGFAMMGGDKKPPANKGGPVAKGSAPVSPNTNGTTGTDEGADPKEKDKVDPKNDKKDPVEKVEPIDPRRKQYPPSDKDERATTNLLPPQTAALFRFNYPRIRQTPFGLIFDPVMAEMFQNSFGFQLSDIATYYHAFVGDTRTPFGLIHLRAPWPRLKTCLRRSWMARPRRSRNGSSSRSNRARSSPGPRTHSPSGASSVNTSSRFQMLPPASPSARWGSASTIRSTSSSAITSCWPSSWPRSTPRASPLLADSGRESDVPLDRSETEASASGDRLGVGLPGRHPLC